jgi:two-component system, NtrC family, nitrogen regulation sensor histidine kinase NtrY
MRGRFRRLAFVQVLLLVATLSILAWTLVMTGHVAVPLVIGIVAALQFALLLRFVEKHIDTLEEFFHAVNYEDFTQHFVTDDVDAELKRAFNQVIERFQDARADRDVQANYLELVVRHIPVPLIAVRGDGSLRLVNNPARWLTGLVAFNHLDDLSALGGDLPERLRAIEPGQQRLLQARIRDVPVELRVAVSEIRIGGDAERLYSIENLSGELTARESSAWRNLIRVLTHEIMNTLTPVSSLAQTSVGLLGRPEAADDVREAIETIARRSEGLMHFVSRYRELLKLPQPSLDDVPVEPAVRGVLTLLARSLEGTEVVVDIHPGTLVLRADPSLLDQLLLNVVKNAIEALEETEAPVIRISARLEYGRTVLRIADNGPGIPEDAADQLFVPFFTTKREGSGIGLSLGRQIMTAHGGDIALTRKDGLTVVSLVF